jgi:uncharacterized protein (TIGR03435 family)
MRRVPCFLVGVAVASVTVLAQTPTQLSFEVMSVKESTDAGQGGRTSGPTPGRYTQTNFPLRLLISDAFQFRDHQLVGVPDWAFATHYDIVGTYPTGATPNVEQLRVMLQNVLVQRFHLIARRETRVLPAYALVLARKDGRLGPGLQRSNTDCQKWLAEKRPQIGAGGPSPVAPGGARPACMLLANRRFITGGTQTIQRLAVALESFVDRVVVDRTGITGAFESGRAVCPEPAGRRRPRMTARHFLPLFKNSSD